MSGPSELDALAPWVQAGGLVAFAAAVLLELRAQRPILVDIRTQLARLLERVGVRDDRPGDKA